MKLLGWMLVGITCFIAALAFAQPVPAVRDNVVGDVVAGVDSCGVVLDGGSKIVIPSEAGTHADGSAGTICRFSLTQNGVANGQHTMTMTAIITGTSTVTGGESDPSSPFAFEKSAKPDAPKSIRIGT